MKKNLICLFLFFNLFVVNFNLKSKQGFINKFISSFKIIGSPLIKYIEFNKGIIKNIKNDKISGFNSIVANLFISCFIFYKLKNNDSFLTIASKIPKIGKIFKKIKFKKIKEEKLQQKDSELKELQENINHLLASESDINNVKKGIDFKDPKKLKFNDQ